MIFGIRKRFRAYRQLEHSDCGIACVRMLARYYGMKVPLKKLREMCDSSRVGITISDIMNALKSLGMHAAGARVALKEVYDMPLPAILFWDQKHFVTLFDIDRKRHRFRVADPASGKVTLSEEDFARHWMDRDRHGIAVLAAPDEDFNPRLFPKERPRMKLLTLLRQTVSAHRKQFAIILLFTVAAMVADTMLPFIFQRTVDEGITQKDIGLVWMLVLSQLMIFVGNYVSNNIVDILLTKLGLKMSMEMMTRYLRQLVGHPIGFFDRKVNSDLIQKVNDQERLKGFLVSTPTTLIITALTLVIFSTLLVYFNYLIFIIFMILSVVSIGWSVIFLRKRREIDYSYFAHASDNRNAVYELIYGMPEIKGNNAQDSRVKVWDATQRNINRLTIKSALLNLAISSGASFFIRLRDIAITGICATLVIQDTMTIGVMMTISYIVGRLSNPFSTITQAINSVQDASLSYERLSEILEKKLPRKEKKSDLGGDIKLSGVSFKYPGGSSPFVITDLDATVRKGEVTAIVGNSGSGKTTLIKLMLGFYHPQKGSVTVGGTDLDSVAEESWLQHCGIVLQNGYIFSDTVLANIAVSDTEPDEEKARNAARLACVDDFIRTMPMGYNTYLGDKGVDLSGGQKQRLLIARAIYKNPDVLFLDEATSSLDANNERAIVENLAGFQKGKTVIIAAHRLSTVKNADNIIFLEDGKVAEQGTHEELIALKGKYWTLVRNQLELGK